MSTKKPHSSVMVKPMPNRLSCGAARVTTPSARLTITSAITAGSAISRPESNTRAPHSTTDSRKFLSTCAGADRQGVKALRQGAEQHQVAVDREVGQHAEDHEHLAEHRGLRAALRIDQGCEAQSHGQRDRLAGEDQRLERQLHHHADRRRRSAAPARPLSIPAAEKIDRSAGTCTSGAIKNASASVRTILTQARYRRLADGGRGQHESADAQHRPPHAAHPHRARRRH